MELAKRPHYKMKGVAASSDATTQWPHPTDSRLTGCPEPMTKAHVSNETVASMYDNALKYATVVIQRI